MKKYLVLLGAALLVMAVATPSMAQFKSWGHMEIATQWISKQDFNNGSGTAATTDDGRDLNKKWIAERFRYYLQYGDPKTVRAVIGFEADSNNWGEAGWAVGESTSLNPSGRMGTHAGDQVQLEIKHAFLEFVIPTTPLTVTAGLQFYGIGGRLFQSKDDPGLTVTANFAPHTIKAFWWRERDQEGSPSYTTYNVNDSYGLSWDMTKQLFNVYAYGVYKNDLDGVTHPTYADHPWWVGVGGGFRPGNWAFSGQFIYNGGTRESTVSGGSDIDYKGWVVEAMAKYKIGPGLAVALEGYYATGDDADKSNEFGEYTYPGGSEAPYGFGNDRFIFSFMNSDFMYYAGKQLYTAGMWYGRLNVEYNPTPWVNLNFNYAYIGDTSKGTPGGVKVVNVISAPTNARQDKDEDYVGSELNVIAKIKIYEGFYYNVGFGYFLPGDVYDSSTKSADSAWSLLTCLRYFF